MLLLLPTRAALLLVAAVAVAIGGCGDDDGAGSTRLSRDELIEQANAVCDAGNERIAAAFEEFEGGGPEEVKAFFDDELLPTVLAQLDELRELQPPDDVAAELQALFDDVEAIVDDLASQSGEDLAEPAEDPFAGVNARFLELGLDACAHSQDRGRDQRSRTIRPAAGAGARRGDSDRQAPSAKHAAPIAHPTPACVVMSTPKAKGSQAARRTPVDRTTSAHPMTATANATEEIRCRGERSAENLLVSRYCTVEAAPSRWEGSDTELAWCTAMPEPIPVMPS
jgi:hypothetical protein